MHYEIDFADVYDNVHFIVRPELTDEGNERDGGIVFASVFEGRAIYPHGDEIIRILQQRLIRLLIVDPFNQAHGFDDGNNNVMIARVAKEMDRITRESGAAGLVLHHLRKGAIGDPDDLMGATSLRATFRSCRILARMTRDQSEKMNLTDYWRYIRVAGSKENYAPPPEKATWFKLIGIALGNATDTYPEGDNIGVATAWSLRPAFEGMDAGMLQAVFAALRGTVHGSARQAKHTPWAGKPLMEAGGRSDREAGKIVALWLAEGVLIEGKYYHAASKHTVGRVILDEAKAALILGQLMADGPPEH